MASNLEERLSERNNTDLQPAFNYTNLHRKVQEGLKSTGIPVFNDCQSDILSHLYEDLFRNLVIRAPKNSGKTLAILLGVLDKLLYSDNNVLGAVIICPTNEIASKTYRIAEGISKCCNMKIFLPVKGKSISKGEKIVCNILISTPDKFLYLAQSNLDIKNLKYLIFKEANIISESNGNLKLMSTIFSRLSKRCKIIITASIMRKTLENFLDENLISFSLINDKTCVAKSFKKIFVTYNAVAEKISAIIQLIKSKSNQNDQIVIFCATKDTIAELEKELKGKLAFEILTGGKTGVKLPRRTWILEKFKENEIRVLITTVAFLNLLETKNITVVINYDQLVYNDKLDLDAYKSRGSLLAEAKNGMSINFVKKQWEKHLFNNVSFKDGFVKQAEMISSLELGNYQF